MERMGSTRGSRSLQATTVVVAALLVAATGCASGDREAVPSASEAPAPSLSATPSASAPANDAPPPVDSGIQSVPVAATCSDLLDPQSVYDYNPNVGVDPQYSPTAVAATALGWEGVACGLLNQTSSERYSFAVARFAADSAERAQDELAAGASAASGVPGDAYFRSSDGSGRIDIFVRDYWIVAESAAFIEAADAAGLLGGVVDALP